MKKTLRQTQKIYSWLFIAAIFLPICLLAQEPAADGLYSGASYMAGQQPKPTKILPANANRTGDSIRLKIADPRQKAAFPVVYTLSVYPNPAVSEARVIFSARENGLPYQLAMVSTNGRRMWLQQGSTIVGVNTVPINISNYPMGTYYIQLMMGNSRQVIRLLKVAK